MFGGRDRLLVAEPVEQPPGAGRQPGRRRGEAGPARGREHGGHQHRLRRGERPGADAEVTAGPGLGAEGGVAPLHHVEVEGEDAPLVEPPLQRHGEERLARLAEQAPLGAQVEVLGQLLGDGGAAAGVAAARQVEAEGLQQLLPVEAVMDPELGVLGGHHGLGEPPRDALQRDPAQVGLEAPPRGPGLGPALLDEGGGGRVGPGQAGRVGQGEPERAQADHREEQGDRGAPDEASRTRGAGRLVHGGGYIASARLGRMVAAPKDALTRRPGGNIAR